MNSRPAQVAKTRADIKSAFWKIFRTKAIQHISISEVINLAGYNRSTFYFHYASCYDVLAEIETDLLQELESKILASFDREREADMILSIAKIYQAEDGRLSHLLSDHGDPYFASRLKSTLKPAVAEYYGIDPLDIRMNYAFEFAFSAILGTLGAWYRGGMNISATELVVMIRRLLGEGVLRWISQKPSSN